MFRIVALTLAAVVSLHVPPVFAAQLLVAGRQTVAAQAPTGTATGAQAPGASISGTAANPGGEFLGNVTVQARDLMSGQIVASTTTSSTGQFSLAVNPGNYVIEVVDSAGRIVGTSAFISVAAGTAVTTAVVASTAALVTAAATTTALVVTAVAAAAGVAGVVAPPTRPPASPSR